MIKLPNDRPAPVPPGLSAEACPKLITARTAIRNLAPFAGGHFLAKQLLVDRLCDGEVRAYAHDRWSTKAKEREIAWQAGAPSDARRKSKVPRSLLDRRAQVLSDSQDWDWRRGRFFITRGANTARHMVLLNDVWFVLSDIHKLAEALNPKGAGGRYTESRAWSDFWLEIVRLALAGQLTKEVQLGREKLAANVFVSLGWDDERKFKKPPLALATLKISAGKIWDRFIEPKPNLQIISAPLRDSRTRARSLDPVAQV